MEGDVAGLEKLLQAQQYQKEDVYCALFAAISRKNCEMTKLLLATGVDPGVTNDLGKTMLHRCASTRSEAVMSFLLNEILKATQDKAEFLSIVNKTCNGGRTPLFLSVRMRDIPCIRLLLKYKADMDSVPSGLRNSYLFQAVCEEAADIEKILLEYKVDLCIRDTKGKGFFSYADKFGKTILELLTELTQRYPQRKADLTQVALFDAIITGDLDTVKTLVELGAKLDHVDQFDRTPLGYMVDRLLECFNSGNGPFSLYEMAKYILTNGGSVHITKKENLQVEHRFAKLDTNGQTLMQITSVYVDISFITVLLETGHIDINAKKQESLLKECWLYPIAAEQVKLFKLLLGLDAEAGKKILGNIACEMPVLFNEDFYIDLDPVCEMLKLVLKAGCDVDIPSTTDCMLSWKIAACHGFTCFLEMLDVAGANFSEVNEFLSNEIKWVISNFNMHAINMTISNKGKKEVVDLLKKLSTCDRTLQQLCRINIRKHLGKQCPLKISQIPGLPRVLVDYLNLPELDLIQQKYTSNMDSVYELYTWDYS